MLKVIRMKTEVQIKNFGFISLLVTITDSAHFPIFFLNLFDNSFSRVYYFDFSFQKFSSASVSLRLVRIDFLRNIHKNAT